MINEQDAILFNDSLERCTQNPDFLGRFYDLFIASSPEVAEKFQNTDMRRQIRALKQSLFLLVWDSTEGKYDDNEALRQVAEKHGPTQLNITPHLYDLWLESLLKAVQEFDPTFTPRIGQAWRNVLAQGIDFMKTH